MEAPAKVALLLSLCLAGYLFPPIGLFVAFLFGFFLIGRGVAGFFGLKLAPLELWVFSILASTAVLTHALFWAAHAFGYSRETIFLVFGASTLLFLKSNVGLGDFKQLKKDKASLAAAALFGLFVFGVLSVSVFEKIPGGIANGGWNWSDFLVHLSFATTLNAGIFPPQTPFFAGEPLIAHYFSDLHAAILALFGNSFEVPVMIFQQAVWAFALFLSAYLFAGHFVKDKKTAILAAALLVLGGGFGFLGLFDDLAGKDPLTAALSSSFDNNWERKPFEVPSVLGTAVLTHRANSFGLPLLILTLWLFLESHDRKGRMIAGALGGLLMPFSYHAFFALMLLFLVVLFVRRKTIRESLEVFVPAVVLSAPFLGMALSRGAGFLKLFPGWLAPKDPAGFLAFYLANFGIVFVLALVGFAVLDLREKRLLAAGALAMFLVPNLIAFTAVEWDMNRFFQFMTIFSAVPAAVLLRKTPKVLFVVLAVAAVASPLLVSAWFIGSDIGALSNADLEAAEWMRANTKPTDVFVTETFINLPTDVAGRLRLLTFTPYARNYALNPKERERDTKTVYCGTADEAIGVMKKYKATHILYRGNEAGCPHAYRTDGRFEKVFSQGHVEVYRLKA